MAEDSPIDRRRFFRRGLSDLFGSLGKTLAPMQRVAEELGRLEQDITSAMNDTGPVRHWLRPPGSVEEQQFREQCSRSGECIRACPAKAIKLDYSGMEGEGVPYILPDEQACVLCTGLSCMSTCPSGAIQQILVQYIDMGTAVWHEHNCMRTKGQDCTICVDTCPVGAKAIRFEDEKIIVSRDGCTGCGVCQHQCPTTPKAITVTPRSGR